MASKIENNSLQRMVQLITDFSRTNLVSSEANTQKKLIEPLIELLGWDPLGKEVVLEYSIKVGSRTTEVDYALSLEGKPIVFIEAKAFDNPLTENDSNQIISYGKIDEVRWAALTNGRLLKIFDTSSGKSEKDCLISEIDLTNPWRQIDEIMLLHRDSILSGEIETTAKRLNYSKQALMKLKDKQNELAESFSQSIISIAGENIKGRVEQISAQLVRRAIELLEDQVSAAPMSMQVKASGVGEISRKELSQKPSGDVILCPSKVEGVDFLKKYNAWGFINLNERRKPRYFALYVGKPESSLQYFGEIDKITNPIKSRQEIGMIQDQDMNTYEQGKRVVFLKPNSLVKFVDPIPLSDRHKAIRGIKYTILEKIITAKRVEDL